jgi:probable HAF family extracellular repeat protein
MKAPAVALLAVGLLVGCERHPPLAPNAALNLSTERAGSHQLSVVLFPAGIGDPGWVAGNGLVPNTTYFGRVGGDFLLTPLSWVSGVNNKGQVVGNTSGGRAAIWEDRRDVVVLPTLGGFASEGAAINNAGHVAGASKNNAGQMRAFYWSPNTGMIEIPLPEEAPPGVLTITAYASGINDRGEVVGRVTYLGGVPEQSIGFIWSASEGSHSLGSLGGRFTYPNAINNSGVVVGTGSTVGGTEFRPFIWTRSTGISQLSHLGGEHANASDVNDAGLIVGHSTTALGEGSVVVYWRSDGSVNEIPGSRNTWYYTPSRVNNRGQVVGVVGAFPEQRTLVWTIK